MSCHFHMMRKRKAAQKAAEAAVSASVGKVDKQSAVKPEAAQKGNKGRRKGEA